MRVAGISCVTNLACGISLAPIDHDDVLAVTRAVAGRFESVVLEWLRELLAGRGRADGIPSAARDLVYGDYRQSGLYHLDARFLPIGLERDYAQ
jgi:hypothetical protein